MNRINKLIPKESNEDQETDGSRDVTNCLHPREVTGGRTGTVLKMLLGLCLIGAGKNEVIDVPIVVMLVVDVDMFTKLQSVLVKNEVIRFEFILSAVFVAELLTDPIIGGVSGIGVEVNTIGLAAMMTALEVVALASSAEPFLSC